MTKDNEIYSFFSFNRTSIDDNIFLKIVCYCGSTIDPEKWEITTDRGFVCGMCLKEDTGLLYEFFKQLGIHEKVNIVRG